VSVVVSTALQSLDKELVLDPGIGAADPEYLALLASWTCGRPLSRFGMEEPFGDRLLSASGAAPHTGRHSSRLARDFGDSQRELNFASECSVSEAQLDRRGGIQ